MQPGGLFLVFSTFIACAVEAVEALTIFLAIGVVRGYRAPVLATVAASVGLVAVVVGFGPALARVPIGTLRLVVGALLLLFGASWLRKAILRASGRRALRDEDAVYRKQVNGARAADSGGGIDWYAFTLVFKAVFLEGLEVAFIVLTVGTAQRSVPLAALGAGAATVVVAAAGAVVRAPLSRVPENTMKFAVGLMLTTFGVFWMLEGVGVAWPGGDLAILGVLALLTAASMAIVAVLRRAAPA
jgi:uncharacterized membrane protein